MSQHGTLGSRGGPRRPWLPQVGARATAAGRLNALQRSNRSVPFWPDGPCAFCKVCWPPGVPGRASGTKGASF
eukprot:4541961-Pyramimonas_sp.AAC.1